MLSASVTTASSSAVNVDPTQVGDLTDAGLFPLARLQKQFEAYLADKQEEIEEAKDARRFYHGVQWTADEIKILSGRGQPPTTYNKVARKVDGIVGISEKQRQDPKAYPRNPGDEQGADVASVTVRYIMERNEWTSKKPHALRQAIAEGIGGIEFRLIQGDEGDPDIELAAVEMEDFFYDPASIRPNFTDARYMGLTKWLDVDEAVELFPDQEEEIRGLIDSGSSYSTNSDRDNRWVRRAEYRVRMVEHWYRSKGEWCWAFYIGSTILKEGTSPFFDERAKTMVRFQMFSAMSDQDGDRYGIVRNLKPIQKEINQRVSILLRLALTRRLIGEQGAVDDWDIARKEWARPDGIVVVNPGKNIKPDDTQAQVAEHTALLQLALNEMEGYYNMNPAALAGPQSKNLSGRAVNLLQAPGLAELVMLLINYRNWIIRVYRTSWNMAQRFWTSERWIRVTDDEKIAQFVQLNGMQLDQYGRPALVNALGALDVDIILDEGPDVQNMMQDAFDQLVQILPALPPGSIPVDILARLMPIPGDIRDKWLEKLDQPPDPMLVQAKQTQLAQAQAKVEETEANTVLKKTQAMSATASAAHKGSEAHLNAQQIFNGTIAAVAQPPAPPPQPQAPMLAVPPSVAPPMPAGGIPGGGSPW